jgi:two-component system CheB/CheR fusion protein
VSSRRSPSRAISTTFIVALHRAVAHKRLVTCPGVVVKGDGEPLLANLAVRPVDAAGSAAAAGSAGSAASVLYLVILEELPPAPGHEPPQAADTGREGRIAPLHRDLRAKDESLQTALEEMKTTNEELQSVNEELQSTNEELETSKEELQSVNEELCTVNAELQDKVAELSRANNDINKLLVGTGVGTVFVDHGLRITRFTPAATPVINLIESDIGRPLEHVASNLVGYDRLVEDLQTVLETLTPHDAEVQVKGGAWYLMRMRPYRTTEQMIEGAVLTLVDISERRRADESLRRGEARMAALINQAYAGVAVTGLDGRFQFANDRLCEILGYSHRELLDMRLADVIDPEDHPRVRRQYQAVAAGGPQQELCTRYVRRDGRRVRVLERISAIRDPGGHATSLLSLSFDSAA